MVRSVGPAGLERIELQRLTERFGRLFAILQEAAEEHSPLAAGAWWPPVDVCETAKAIFVRIELPGVSAGQIKIRLQGERLRISGEKNKRSSRRRIISHLCSERAYGTFDRAVPLRCTIAVKKVTAELANGLLAIRLPKTQERRGSEFKIPIVEKEASK